MFTGIIRYVGTVERAVATPQGRRLTAGLGPLAQGLALGDSVAVAGVCLTVTAVAGQSAGFDVIAETLGRTTLGRLRRGSKVNLERSLRPDQGLDGHLVQGHIDGLAAVRHVRRRAECGVEFEAGNDLTDLMVPKGSVAVDGVSLTLVDVAEGAFSVALIPATLAATTLGELRPGDKVNIETDVIGKYVRKYLRELGMPAQGSVTVEKLKEAGFI